MRGLFEQEEEGLVVLCKVTEDKLNGVGDLRNITRFQNNASPRDIEIPSLQQRERDPREQRVAHLLHLEAGMETAPRCRMSTRSLGALPAILAYMTNEEHLAALRKYNS